MLDNGDRRALLPFNLTTSQYNALLLLDDTNGQRLVQLSERLLLDKSTITRLIDQLEQAGLAQRVTDPDDRRAQRVILTPLGVERRDQAQIAHNTSLEQRMSSLSQDEQHQLYELLRKLRTGLLDDLEQQDI
ncbi:MAG TPA: MarR family transcriptional regulator [Aggregatilinea sp.]|uniref:MarR family winged helix-turn-helix transcriptional regulator n=1 Tax=Aggregatilinea sp. TaxID=2806333 RepID=UPI002D1BC015|nr:MarR family transcriptional regulator [Aggregatilinea sp.]HML20273.1 MarR family transcriptional regulator [Aggregatilinea sp.]